MASACSAASTLAACGASSWDTTNSATSCDKPPEQSHHNRAALTGLAATRGRARRASERKYAECAERAARLSEIHALTNNGLCAISE